MTAATGLKRLAIFVGVVIAAGIAAISAASFLVSPEGARNAVKAQIRAVTGLDPVLRGPVEVSLFPYGSVSLVDVVLGEAGSPTPPLAAERLVAHLRFLPLLLGRIEIADIALDHPRIALDIDADGRSNWTPLLASLAHALKPVDRIASFTEIRIDHGTIAIAGGERRKVESLTDVDLSLAWPAISKSFGATGRFTWHGEPVETSVIISDFLAALTGVGSGLKVRLNGAPLRLAFEGTLSNQPSLKADGTLSVEAASLRDALRWTGDTPVPGGGFGRFALKGQARLLGSAISLSGVNVELDGNAAEGVLTYAANGQKTWQGTLDASELDLTPYVSTVRVMASNTRDWNRGPMSLDVLTAFEIDLRLSAAKVTIGHARLGRTAVAASLRGGKLLVTVGEAQAYGGVIRGSIALAKADSGAEVKSDMRFADVDLDACLGELFGMRRVEGKGNMSFGLEAAGESVFALTRNISGTVNLSAEHGALAGINVEQVLRRLERRPLSPGDYRNGRTPFDRLSVTLKVANGDVSVADTTVDGAAVRIALAGTASIPTRELDLKGTAALLNGPNEVAFELPFVVIGPWDSAMPLPDPASLIQRSGAAAPLLDAVQAARDRNSRDKVLLDAVRDRDTRDKVRSALDRLMGPKPAAQAAPTAPTAAAGQ